MIFEIISILFCMIDLLQLFFFLFQLTFLIIHSTSATLDKLANLDLSSLDLGKLKDTAANTLQTITDTATSSLQQFADTIDFEKVQKLDILNLIPKIQNKGKLIVETYENIPEYSQKVKDYLQSIKMKKLAPEKKLVAPWPVKVRVIHHYYYD